MNQLLSYSTFSTMESTTAGLADAVEQASQVLARASWNIGITPAWYSVKIRFKCEISRREIRFIRSRMQSIEAPRDEVREQASQLGRLVERFDTVWDDQTRRLFMSNSILRFAAPGIDALYTDLEDFEEAMALASSERFSDFVQRSLEESS